MRRLAILVSVLLLIALCSVHAANERDQRVDSRGRQLKQGRGSRNASKTTRRAFSKNKSARRRGKESSSVDRARIVNDDEQQVDAGGVRKDDDAQWSRDARQRHDNDAHSTSRLLPPLVDAMRGTALVGATVTQAATDIIFNQPACCPAAAAALAAPACKHRIFRRAEAGVSANDHYRRRQAAWLKKHEGAITLLAEGDDTTVNTTTSEDGGDDSGDGDDAGIDDDDDEDGVVKCVPRGALFRSPHSGTWCDRRACDHRVMVASSRVTAGDVVSPSKGDIVDVVGRAQQLKSNADKVSVFCVL
jgi:hypothetical protein